MSQGESFPVLRVTVGGLTKSALQQRMRAADVHLVPAVEQLVERAPLYPGEPPYGVQVAFVSAAQLGYTHGAVLARIYQRALGFGFKLGPLALAPFVSLAWPRQSGDAQLPTLAWLATHAPGSGPQGFALRDIGGRRVQLETFSCGAAEILPASAVFGFVMQ